MTMTLEEFSGPSEMTQLELSDSMELSVSCWTLVVLTAGVELEVTVMLEVVGWLEAVLACGAARGPRIAAPAMAATATIIIMMIVDVVLRLNLLSLPLKSSPMPRVSRSEIIKVHGTFSIMSIFYF
jgi:hypothetical protein